MEKKHSVLLLVIYAGFNMNYFKRAKKQINDGNSKLIWLDHFYGILDRYSAELNGATIFIVDKENFRIFSCYDEIDSFLENYGFGKKINGNIYYFIDLPYSIKPEIETLRIILQEIFDSFLLDNSLQCDTGKKVDNFVFLFDQ